MYYLIEGPLVEILCYNHQIEVDYGPFVQSRQQATEHMWIELQIDFDYYQATKQEKIPNIT